MTLPVDDMRWCSWCQQTRAVGHDCAGGSDAPPCLNPNPETGGRCGICETDIALQEADLGVTQPPDGDTP